MLKSFARGEQEDMTGSIAVGFDLGETLLEYTDLPLSWIGEYPAALAQVARACLLEPTHRRLESGSEVLLRYNARVTPRPEQMEYPADHIFRDLLVAWELPQDCLANAIGAFFGHFTAKIRAFPESAAVIHHLREIGVPFGVLTDVPYGMPPELVWSDLSGAGLEIPENHVLTSTMVGHRKPHRAGFEALADRLHVARSDLLYVGNERKDIEGGTAAGCRAVLVWRASGEAPAWGQEATIRSLDGLRKLLR